MSGVVWPEPIQALHLPGPQNRPRQVSLVVIPDTRCQTRAVFAYPERDPHRLQCALTGRSTARVERPVQGRTGRPGRARPVTGSGRRASLVHPPRRTSAAKYTDWPRPRPLCRLNPATVPRIPPKADPKDLPAGKHVSASPAERVALAPRAVGSKSFVTGAVFRAICHYAAADSVVETRSRSGICRQRLASEPIGDGLSSGLSWRILGTGSRGKRVRFKGRIPGQHPRVIDIQGA